MSLEVVFTILKSMKDNVIYHLANCKTCQRIIAELPIEESGISLVNVKPSIDPAVVDNLKTLAGSYEALFSRRSLQFRKLGLHERELNEEDYRHYIIEHYSFLKRPVAVIQGEIFIGSAKKSVEALTSAVKALQDS